MRMETISRLVSYFAEEYQKESGDKALSQRRVTDNAYVAVA